MDLPRHATVCVFRYNRCGERGNSRQWCTNTGRQIAMVTEFCTSLGPRCGTCVMSPIGHLKFGGGSQNFWGKKLCIRAVGKGSVYQFVCNYLNFIHVNV